MGLRTDEVLVSCVLLERRWFSWIGERLRLGLYCVCGGGIEKKQKQEKKI